MSHLAFFAHANAFHHGDQPVPIELSIANCQFRKMVKIQTLFSNGGPLEPPHDPQRPPGQQGQVFSPGLRKQRSHRRQGIGPAENFEKVGLFTINLEMLPHFRDLNDRTLPDHLHDEVHENYDISEYTMVKSYRFARYLQHFNKLQAECKKQTAHLVE
ncbi:hypothetical protein TNCV_2368351 [Trichonephila clavipes]|nr:hypothetical protein TNCV_2368351 [Trichonephila clavipes]